MATALHALDTGSPWGHEAEAAWRATREAPDRCGVVIVGAGVAGLTTALLCAQEGDDVVVLERAGIGAGETLRTTAHLASALDDRFHRLAHWHGADGARLAAASHAEAVDWIEDFVAGGDSCGFKRVRGYLFAHDGDVSRLEKEVAAAADAGLHAQWTQAIPALPGLGGAIVFEDQARIDMGRYLARLARACAQAGVRLCRVGVVDVDGGDEVRVQLEGGGVVLAGAAVLATNVPFHERFAVHTKQAAYRTYVVAGRVHAGDLPDALLWDDGDPYHYVRLLEDGDGLLALVGGEDHKTGQDVDPLAFDRLRQWAAERLPAIGPFTHAWSGQVLEPVDGLAFLGRDAGGQDNVYVITGDSGNGVTHGTVGAMLVTDLIHGRDNPWRDLYDPSRKVVRAGGGWTRENANVALQYRDWLAPGRGHAHALAPGQGAVVRRGLHRVAVHRRPDGGWSAFLARCPHLGCAVRWNPVESSWDCPCHGSRFDGADGRVLNGPASRPLAAFDWHDEAAP